MADKPNAFRAELLAATEELDAPATLPMNEFAGPWEVAFTPGAWEPRHDGWTVRNLDGGDAAVVAQNFETAALIASVLPLESRPPAYDKSDSLDQSVEVKTKVMGGIHQAVARFVGPHPDTFDDAIETAYLAASCPRSLAWIMAAASTETLSRAGEILMEILEKRAEDQRQTDQAAPLVGTTRAKWPVGVQAEE